MVLVPTCLTAGLGADKTTSATGATAPSAKQSSADQDDLIPTPPQRPSSEATTPSPPIVIRPNIVPQAGPSAPSKAVSPARQEIITMAQTAATSQQSGHRAEAAAQY